MAFDPFSDHMRNVARRNQLRMERARAEERARLIFWISGIALAVAMLVKGSF